MYWWNLLGDISCILVLRPAPRRVYRDKALASLVFGNSGGQARARCAELLDSGLKDMYNRLVIDHGPEHAVEYLCRLLAKDDKNPPTPEWFLRKCRKYPEAARSALMEEHRDSVPARSTGAKPVFAGTFPKRKAKLG